MALWTMTPNGQRVLVVPAHRSYAAAMTEDNPLVPEGSERLKAALKEKDRNMGRPQYITALARSPSVARNPWGRTGATSRVSDQVRRLLGTGRRRPGRRKRLPGPLSSLPGANHRQGRDPMAQGGPPAVPALRKDRVVMVVPPSTGRNLICGR